jgi:hypothetical protein
MHLIPFPPKSSTKTRSLMEMDPRLSMDTQASFNRKHSLAHGCHLPDPAGRICGDQHAYIRNVLTSLRCVCGREAGAGRRQTFQTSFRISGKVSNPIYLKYKSIIRLPVYFGVSETEDICGQSRRADGPRGFVNSNIITLVLRCHCRCQRSTTGWLPTGGNFLISPRRKMHSRWFRRARVCIISGEQGYHQDN